MLIAAESSTVPTMWFRPGRVDGDGDSLETGSCADSSAGNVITGADAVDNKKRVTFAAFDVDTGADARPTNKFNKMMKKKKKGYPPLLGEIVTMPDASLTRMLKEDEDQAGPPAQQADPPAQQAGQAAQQAAQADSGVVTDLFTGARKCVAVEEVD